MRSNQGPEIIKFMKKSKKWNLMKTLLSTVLLIGWDITNQHIFHSKIVENHVCNPNMSFGASNDRKYQKMTQNGVQRGTQNVLKNHWKSILGPSRVHLCASVTHLIAKWCQNGAQGPPRWLKNGHLGTLKGAKNSTKSSYQVYNKEIYIFNVLIDFNPGNKFFYSCQSFSLQISRPLVTRGAGGRGEALG